jgi:hypothetical protein
MLGSFTVAKILTGILARRRLSVGDASKRKSFFELRACGRLFLTFGIVDFTNGMVIEALYPSLRQPILGRTCPRDFSLVNHQYGVGNYRTGLAASNATILISMLFTGANIQTVTHGR